MNKNKIYALLIFFIMLVSVQSTFAHLEGGIDVSDGKNVVDVGYDAANLTSLRPTVFLLSLHTVNGIEINSTTVWAKISSDKGIVFSAKLFPEPTGAYSFTTLFPEEGNYKLTARFSTQKGDVENSANLNVMPGSSSASSILIKKIIVESTIVLFLLFMLIRNLMKKENINGGKRK